MSRSLLIVGLLALASCSPSSAQSSGPADPTVLVAYAPHPRDMRQIVEGAALIVPPGRVFVLTNLTRALPHLVCSQNPDPELIPSLTLPLWLTVNGSGDPCPRRASFIGLGAQPSGFTVPAGATVEVWSEFASNGQSDFGARAWGYLADG